MDELTFWLNCWQDNEKLFFHLNDVHPLLKKYFRHMGSLNDKSVVFVPLAGKTLDLLWLKEFYQVVAVEISEIAVNDFFKENKLRPKITTLSFGKKYQLDNLVIYQANLFDLPASVLAPITHIYDRASLIALNEKTRAQYLSFLKDHCLNLKEWFLVTLDFKATGYKGPPFPLSSNWIINAFKGFEVEMIHNQKNKIESSSRLYQKGVRELFNQVYTLRPCK